jgi:hypothetical protein
MRKLSIGDVKAKLSSAATSTVPAKSGVRSGPERRLIASGVLVPPLKKRPSTGKWPKPPGNVSDKVMKRVWREEREGP